MVRGTALKEAGVKLRMKDLWGRPQPREQLEQEANEELDRVAAVGPETDMDEPTAAADREDMAQAADAEGVAAEFEVAGAGADTDTGEPRPPRADHGAGDGIHDWQERMAEVRQGRR